MFADLNLPQQASPGGRRPIQTGGSVGTPDSSQRKQAAAQKQKDLEKAQRKLERAKRRQERKERKERKEKRVRSNYLDVIVSPTFAF